MRIVHILKGKANPDTLNGVNRVVHWMATSQLRLGHEVEVWGLAESMTPPAHPREYRLRLFPVTRPRVTLAPEIKAALATLSPGTWVHFHSVFIPEYPSIARLLTRRGFGAADFRMFHPGGKLGAKLRRVREVMHGADSLPLAAADTPMYSALLTMTAKRFGCLGVVGETGTLDGIITDGDLRRAMGPDLLDQTTGEIMTRAPRTIGPDALAAEALLQMNAPDRSVTALFVVDADRRPIGILHIHDLLRAGVA